MRSNFSYKIGTRKLFKKCKMNYSDYSYNNSWRIDEWSSATPGTVFKSPVYDIPPDHTNFQFKIMKPTKFDNTPFEIIMKLIFAKDMPHYVRTVFQIQHHRTEAPHTTTIKCFSFENRNDGSTPKKTISTNTPTSSVNSEILIIFFTIVHMKKIPRSLSMPIPSTSSMFASLKRSYGKATCYLNAIMVVLYNIPAFRYLIFSVPNMEEERIETIIIRSLQCLFAKMNTPNAYSTSILTKSFGWPKEALEIQHDAQEFLCKFLDKLKTRLPPIFEKKLEELFYGIERQFTITDGVTETNDHIFNCIQIKNITELRSLTMGLRQYTSDDRVAENKILRTKFVKLPQVLFFHVCRFVQNEFQTLKKTEHPLSYPKILDMTEFLTEYTGKSRVMYELYAVIVHTGDINSGHYYSYVKPTAHEPWVKINDSSCIVVNNEREIIQNNFGKSQLSQPANRRNMSSRPLPVPTAYILMYMNVDQIEELMAPENPVDPPLFARQYAQHNLNKKKTRSMSNLNDNNNDSILTFTIMDENGLKDSIMKGNRGFDSIVPWKTFDLPRSTTHHEFFTKVSEALGKPVDRFRLWRCDIKKSPVFTLQNDSTTFLNCCKIDCTHFLDCLNDEETNPNVGFSQLFLFVIVYDPNEENPFKYGGKIIVERGNCIEVVEKMLPSLDTMKKPLNYFFQKEGNEFLELKPSQNFGNIEKIRNGNIIIVQSYSESRKPDYSHPTYTFAKNGELTVDENGMAINHNKIAEKKVEILEKKEEIIEINDKNNKLEKSSPSIVDHYYDNMEYISYFEKIEEKFPLSIKNMFIMKEKSLLFHISLFGKTVGPKYAVKVPSTMNLISFKQFLANKILKMTFNSMKDTIMIFKSQRPFCPSTVPLPKDGSAILENLFKPKTKPVKKSSLKQTELDKNMDDKNQKPIEIYVQLFNNIKQPMFPYRVSFSTNGISPSHLFEVIIPTPKTTFQNLCDDIVKPLLPDIFNFDDYRILRIKNASIDYELLRTSRVPRDFCEVRFEKIPEDQKIYIQTEKSQDNEKNIEESSECEKSLENEKIEEKFEVKPLIKVSYGAEFCNATVLALGHPFLMPVDGTKEEVLARIEKMTIGLLPNEQTSLMFVNKEGEIVDHDISHIKEAQNNKLILFIVIKGVNAEDFFSLRGFFEEHVKILN
ncbi:hypothetical protein TRFO_40335 [Tritrichomonas foetus]|uniref:USP domain-containing protein n=1 Tax=Tritrichomonas foetus TaxID=1144522 RepID=A0A1J4J821_9EUKA|nr:hypothetical protein TRFO_40335 [Tritrichomonas foetus]|eukprot:OHS93372.1 hypothetical protein TRFO_40335 [Tritrichomonas foetus]